MAHLLCTSNGMDLTLSLCEPDSSRSGLWSLQETCELTIREIDFDGWTAGDSAIYFFRYLKQFLNYKQKSCWNSFSVTSYTAIMFSFPSLRYPPDDDDHRDNYDDPLVVVDKFFLCTTLWLSTMTSKNFFRATVEVIDAVVMDRLSQWIRVFLEMLLLCFRSFGKWLGYL